MTAPHDEEWKTGEDALSGALYSGDTWIGSFADPTRARLAVQAPKMAQALLGVLENDGHARGCQGGNQEPLTGACSDGCAAIRAVLKSCGVIP